MCLFPDPCSCHKLSKRQDKIDCSSERLRWSFSRCWHGHHGCFFWTVEKDVEVFRDASCSSLPRNCWWIIGWLFKALGAASPLRESVVRTREERDQEAKKLISSCLIQTAPGSRPTACRCLPALELRVTAKASCRKDPLHQRCGFLHSQEPVNLDMALGDSIHCQR